VVTGGGAYYAFALQTGEIEQPSAESEATTQTAVAQKGDLTVLSSGTGQLVALDETSLNFDDSGTLIELLVRVGEEVSAGTVLARVRMDKTEAQLAAEIAAVELEVLEAQQALDALYTDAEITAAQALYELEIAQDELADLLNYDLEVAQAMQAVALAEEAVEDAEMMLYIYNSSPSDDEIYTAYASLLFKEKKLSELQDELAHLEYEFKKARDEFMRDRIEAQIERVTAQMYNQQISVEAAQYRYETIDDPADSLDLQLAQTQMDTAQAQLAQASLDLAEAQQGAPAGELALAEANVAEAQAAWERWQDGPDAEAVTLAETRLAAAQLELQLAQQESLTVDLIAPIAGTVMSIDAVVNQDIEGDTILTLADISQPRIEISLDETDFQSAQVGNRVEVIFDALPDTVFSGSIVDISPGLESTFGSQAIKAWAILDESSFAQPSGLPLGLNAAVDVISGEVTGAVLIPIEAIHETTPGNYIVYVLVDETFEAHEVTVGLMDYTSAAITSGLEAGEIVAIEAID
jgi:multidrug efflux pump subunit AcrA (membrane-fusion protein)